MIFKIQEAQTFLAKPSCHQIKFSRIKKYIEKNQKSGSCSRKEMKTHLIESLNETLKNLSTLHKQKTSKTTKNYMLQLGML